MMRTPILLLLCTCLFGSPACKKEKNAGCDSMQSPHLRWKVDYPESFPSGSDPILNLQGDHLIVFRDKGDLMEAYDPDSGDLLWYKRFSDLGLSGLSLPGRNYVLGDGVLLRYASGELFGFSMQSGSLLFQKWIGYKSKIELSFVGGRFFVQSESSSAPYWAEMQEIILLNGDVRVLSSEPSGQAYPYFKQPATWENPVSGNTWLLWRLNQSLAAYDLDADSLVYIKPIGAYRDARAYGLLVSSNTLFVPFDTVVYAYSLPNAELTGAILYNSANLIGPPFLMENRLIVQYEPDEMLAYNVSNGTVSTLTDNFELSTLRMVNGSGGNGLFLGYYEDELYAVNLEQLCRPMLFKAGSKLGSRNIVPSPNGKSFYFSDYYALYHYEIP
jgi:hypothetical protein